MKYSNKLILILILVVACVLRFYNLFDIPFINDEFSALYRTHVTSFAELIEKGVIADTLPAGVQVFLYYWIKLFGSTEWVVKLPFILFGIFSVYLIYLVAKKWYNETVALVCSAFLASLQYTVFYSQVARPYISGLFFSLLMVYSWSNLIKTPEKKFLLNSVVFILAAAVCSYNHHFSLVFAVIVGASGLFLIQRKFFLKYIACCFIIMILYIPHINIILCQLKMGGNEGWIGEVQNTFFINYMSYVFQFSTLSYLLIVLLIVFGLVKIKKQDVNYKQFILFSCWFIIPFVVGFLYSKFVNNVMQFSVLIFSFPYLLFILFGHIKQQKTIINLLLVLAILAVNTYALVVERKHYTLFYNSIYERIMTDHQDAVKSHKSLASIVDSDKVISEYYARKLNLDTNFVWYDSFVSEKGLITFLQKEQQRSEFLFFGCLSSNNPVSVALIQDYFPTIVQQKNYFGGTTYLFSKAISKGKNIIEYQDFEKKENMYWSSMDKSKFVDTISFSGKCSYEIDSSSEFSFLYSRPLKEIINHENNFIDISVKVCMPDTNIESNLVATLSTEDSVYYWGASAFYTYKTNKTSKEGWVTVHHSVKLSDINVDMEKMKLNVNIWNKSRSNYLVDDIIIKLRTGNPVIYKLFLKK
ncbi:MAG TPA: glycosyltransferase family 39 protein [Bacteroidales bacterium]|nr:glycosyltransferase family 39 protein [Bacteroidales bacterium]